MWWRGGAFGAFRAGIEGEQDFVAFREVGEGAADFEDCAGT